MAEHINKIKQKEDKLEPYSVPKSSTIKDNRSRSNNQKSIQNKLKQSLQDSPFRSETYQLERKKKSKYNRKDRALAKRSGLHFSVEEQVNPRIVNQTLADQRDYEKGQMAVDQMVYIFKKFESEVNAEALKMDFTNLFLGLEDLMKLDDKSILLTIGQSPEFFREFIRLKHPSIKIVHLPLSGVSEAVSEAKKSPMLSYFKNYEDVILGQGETSEFLDKIYNKAALANSLDKRICIVDYSSTGNTLNFFRDWLMNAKDHTSVEIFEMNHEKLKPKTNIYLRLLKSKGEEENKRILDKLRFIVDKIELKSVSEDTIVKEDPSTVNLAVNFAQELLNEI